MPIVLIVLALAVLIGALALLKGDDYSKLDDFPATAFLEGPADYMGNEYVMRAQIDSQLQWERGTGRLVAVKPEMASSRLPVFIPEGTGQNVQSGQRYEMYIRIEEGGLIYVEDLRKY